MPEQTWSKSQLEDSICRQFHVMSTQHAELLHRHGFEAVDKLTQTWLDPLLRALTRFLSNRPLYLPGLVVESNHIPVLVVWPKHLQDRFSDAKVNSRPAKSLVQLSDLSDDVTRDEPYLCLDVSGGTGTRGYRLDTIQRLGELNGHMVCTASEGIDLVRERTWQLFNHPILLLGSKTATNDRPILQVHEDAPTLTLVSAAEFSVMQTQPATVGVAICGRRLFAER